MITICFSGMDGAGKSTQCHSLIRRFREIGVDVKSVHMLSHGKTIGSKSQSLPLMKQIHRKLRDLSGNGIYRGIKLIAGLSYYLIDSWGTYTVHKIKYSNNVVIYDRYFYDLLAIFACNFDRIPWWVIHFAKIFPQGNIIIIMEAHPEIAQQRKPEHSIEVLTRYHQVYRRLADTLKIKTINGTKGIAIAEEEVNQRCHPIFKLFNKQSKEKNFGQ